MKKLLLFVAAVMLLGSAAAQGLPKNIVGVRAGANFSSLDYELLGALDLFDFRTNFNAGVSYERLLLKNLPLYLETGLHYSNKGFKISDFYDYEYEDDYEYDYEYEDESSYGARTSLGYIEVPVMLNYKFFIGNDIALYPSAGLYYAFGVAGNTVETFEGEKLGVPSDVFGEDGLKRSDFGYRVSISTSWRNFVLSAGYEGSILNVAQPLNIGDVGILSLKATNLNIFVTLGYNLNF